MKKYLILIVFFIATYVRADAFESESYRIEIKHHCKITNVDCNKATFNLLNKSTGEEAMHFGDIHRSSEICSDGTRCKLFAYWFKSGELNYILFIQKEELTIRSINKREALLREYGSFDRDS